MKKSHPHGVQQRPFQAAEYRSDQLRPWAGTKALRASQSK
jgi:hypothetical protein